MKRASDRVGAGAPGRPADWMQQLTERVNGILKGEFLLVQPESLDQTKRIVAESIQIYNAERPHLSLQMQTPDEVHRASLAG